MSCELCKQNNIDLKRVSLDKYDFLQTIMNHVNYKITYETFDDERNVNNIFQKLIIHCTPKGTMNTYNKKKMIEEYRNKIQDRNIIFERLIFEVSNGEVCVSVPSKALGSCPHNCAFCPTANNNSESNELVVAKSYTLGQPVFAHLVVNKNNLIKYLLQHIIVQHVSSLNIFKLAMRHLGGTFSVYDILYRFTYSRDIFYAANILHTIIDDPELFQIAKQSLQNEFDPDNIIMNKIRKPFNHETIDKLIKKIDECKLWKDKFDQEIKNLEETLLIEMKKSLSLEQAFNITAKSRIVSYSIETRPDYINSTSIKELLILGVTIVELGLQSPNDDILDINKRGHTVECSKKAIRMLKDNGLHVHGQWMMDLPGSTKELDSKAIQDILSDDLRCDQIKIYPHLSMPGTETKEWLDSGLYESWVAKDKDGFYEVLSDFIVNIDETTRVVRVQRDLPKASDKILDGYTNDQPSNLEQIITNKINKSGRMRQDIRYHEPGLRFLNMKDIKYYVDIKKMQGGTDIFISAQSIDTTGFRVMWGYCRLRIVEEDEDTNVIKFFKQNKKFGRIRELKVNGSVENIGNIGNSGQHRGIGSSMLKIAEEIAYKYGMTHVTVTSAVGVRDYYRLKHGYQLSDCGLMYKELGQIKFNKKLVKVNDTKFLVIDKPNKHHKILLYMLVILITVSIIYMVRYLIK
jgi:ELP3 family radical SAM enzyme/protein acetyltransferase